jgi:hypothetical protein
VGATTIRELVASFGLEFDDKGSKKLDTSIGGAVDKLGGLGAALAGIAGAAGIGVVIHEVIHLGSEINDMSLQLGVNAQELQRWQFAAGLAGVDAGTLSTSIRKLQQNASGAAGGSKELTAGFESIGVSVRDASGQLKTGDQLLNETSIGLSQMTNDTERVALATKLFGRAGAKLIPLFKEGAHGIAEMKAEADELGGVLGDDLIKASDEAGDNIDRMAFASRGLKVQIANLLMPAIVRMTGAMVKGAKWFNEFTQKTNVLKIVLAAVGAVAIKTAFALITPFIPALLLMGAYILIVDELWTTFTGGDSIISRTIDLLFGVGATKAAIEAVTEAASGIAFVYRDQVIPALEDAGKLSQEVSSQWISDWSEVASFISDSVGGAIDAIGESFAGFADDWIAGFDLIKQSLPKKLADLLGIDQSPTKARDTGARDRLARREAAKASVAAQQGGADANRVTLQRGTGAKFAVNRAGASATLEGARARENFDRTVGGMHRGTGRVIDPAQTRAAFESALQQTNNMNINVHVPAGTTTADATTMMQVAIDRALKNQHRRAHHALKHGAAR